MRLLRVAPMPEVVMGPYGRTVAYVDQEMARVTAAELEDLARIEDAVPGSAGGERRPLRVSLEEIRSRPRRSRRI